ncbi:MAG: zinc ribbon domain-containing protein [Actinomycetes bacterium]
MKAEPEIQLRLLDLQALDSRLDRLAHRRRTLPEHAELERLDARLDELRDAVVAAQTEDEDAARDQSKAEADVEQVRSRAARDQQRLDAGSVGSAKELESLQHELGSLAKRQSDLEEVVLEVMERREDAQKRLASTSEERDRLTAERDQVDARRQEAFTEIDAETASTTAERKTISADVPQDLLALYERLREQNSGVGAAALHRRRCEGCRLELTPSDIGRLRDAAPDEVLRCEECRRILVRTADSGL